MQIDVPTAVLVTPRENFYRHVLGVPQHQYKLHCVSTISDALGYVQAYAAVVLLIDSTDDIDQSVYTHVRQQTPLPVIGIVDDSQSADKLIDLIPNYIDALLVRSASVGEWITQIHATLQRNRMTQHAGVVVCGDLTIDLGKQTVSRTHELIPLGKILWRIVQILAQSAPHTVSSTQLIEHVWQYTADAPSVQDLRKPISLLQKKLQGNSNQRYILKERNGYRLASPDVQTLSPFNNGVPVLSLPIPRTSFIGRVTDLADLHQLLKQQTRLLSLIGPGGVGKTRLALQAAMNARLIFSDAVYILPLAEITRGDHIASHLAQILGIQEHVSIPLLRILCDHLQQRSMLLIFDNAEHLIGDVALLVAKLLDANPYLCVMVTSREPLDIYGEQVFAVNPLDTPLLSSASQPCAQSNVAGSEAVQLFVDRARLAQRHFVLTDTTYMDVVRICTYVDGIPLAIEFAAGRVKDIALSDIACELGQQQHMRLLTSTLRDQTYRQQTLYGALTWSYERLTDIEQSLFRLLGCFVTSFTTDAVHAIWNYHGTRQQTEKYLQALARKSLLSWQTVENELCWYMLQIVHVYAHEQLVKHDEHHAVFQRRASYYCVLLEGADEGLIEANQGAWILRIEREYATIHDILLQAEQQRDRITLQHIVGAIWRFWMVKGTIHEGLRWCMYALEDISLPQLDAVDLTTRCIVARALNAGGSLALLNNNRPRAYHLLTEALRVYKHSENVLGTARVLNNLGLLVFNNGLGDVLHAQDLYQESLTNYRKLNDPARLTNILCNLAEVDVVLGHYEDAENRLNEVITLAQTFSYTQFEAYGHEMYGNLALLRSQMTAAYTLYHRSYDLYATIPSTADMLRVQIQVAGTHPSVDEAIALLQDACESVVQLHDDRLTINIIETTCLILVQIDPESATCLSQSAKSLRESLAVPRTPYEIHLYGPLDNLSTHRIASSSVECVERERETLSLSDCLDLAQSLMEIARKTQVL